MLKYLCETDDSNCAALVALWQAKGKTIVEQDGAKYAQIDNPTNKDKLI